MNSKIKIKTKAYSLLLASVISMVSFPSCRNKSSSVIDKPSIAEKHNNFNSFAEHRLTKAKAELCYKGENILVLINKETNEISRYIYNRDLYKTEVYELDSQDMIMYIPLNIYELSQGLDYYNNLIENSYIFKFDDIDNYIEGETCKKWYTLEEIEEIESRLLRFLLNNKDNKKILKRLK